MPPVRVAQRRILQRLGGSGPNLFTQTLAAGVTPAGKLVKVGQKPEAATVHPTALTVKVASKVSSAGVTPAGSLVKLILKTLAGAVTPTATSLESKISKQTGAASVTPVGAVVKVGQKNLAAGTTPAASRGPVLVRKVHLPGVTPAGASVEQQTNLLPLRAAFYYPWFTVGGDPGFPGSWTQAFSPFTQFHPKLGYYDSATTSVIDNHIGAMTYGKFKVGISSWWGQGSREDTMFSSLLSRAATLNTGFKWCIYYEGEGNTISGVTGSPDPTAAQITADLNYLTANFTSHPNYLHVNGKPVIFAFGDAGDGSQSAPNLPSARWFAGNAAANEDWYYVLKVYAGYTGDAHQPPDWHQYGPAVYEDQQGTHSFTASPGFWLASETTPRLARTFSNWVTTVKDMLAATVNWYLVTSFNEWGEGHAVEDADGNSGRDYTGIGWDTTSGFGFFLDLLHTDGLAASYPQTLSATVHPTGAAVKQAQKNLTAGVTPAGSLVKTSQKVLGGLVTPASVLIKKVLQTRSAGVTPSGSLTKAAQKVLAGAVTPASILIKQANKNLAAAVTPAGSAVKQSQRSLSGTVHPTASAIKQANKVLAGTVHPTAASLNSTTRSITLAAAVTPAAVLIKQAQKVLSSGVTPAGVLVKQTLKSLSGTVHPTGALVKSVLKTFSGTVHPTATLTTSTIRNLILAASVTPAGALIKQALKTLSGSSAPSGSRSWRTNQSRSAAVTPASSVVKVGQKNLAATEHPTGTLSRALAKTFSAALTPAGSLSKQANKSLSSTSHPTTTTSRLSSKVLAAACAPTGLLTKAVSKTLAGTVHPAGVLSRVVTRTFQGLVAPTASLATLKITGAGVVRFMSDILGVFRSHPGTLFLKRAFSNNENTSPSAESNLFVSRFADDVLGVRVGDADSLVTHKDE